MGLPLQSDLTQTPATRRLSARPEITLKRTVIAAAIAFSTLAAHAEAPGEQAQLARDHVVAQYTDHIAGEINFTDKPCYVPMISHVPGQVVQDAYVVAFVDWSGGAAATRTTYGCWHMSAGLVVSRDEVGGNAQAYSGVQITAYGISHYWKF